MEYLEVSSQHFDTTHNLDNEQTMSHLSRRKKRRMAAAVMTGGIGLALGGRKKKRKKNKMIQPVQESTTGQEMTPSPMPSQAPEVDSQQMPPEIMDEMPEPLQEAMGNTDITNPEVAYNDEDMQEQGFENHVTKVGKFLRKAGKSKFLTVATGGLNKLGSKEGRSQIKNLAKNINPLFLPLMPLRPLMKNALKHAGHPVSKNINITDLANQFYQNVVKKSKVNKFENLDDIPDLNTLDFESENHIVEAAISGIINGILSFIKGIKAKKASGAKLSPLEAKIAGSTEAVEKTLSDKAKAEVKDRTAAAVGGALLFNKKTQLIVVGVIVAIIVVVIIVMRKK